MLSFLSSALLVVTWERQLCCICKLRMYICLIKSRIELTQWMGLSFIVTGGVGNNSLWFQ
jgi:lipoprotein signal peptidase